MQQAIPARPADKGEKFYPAPVEAWAAEQTTEGLRAKLEEDWLSGQDEDKLGIVMSVGIDGAMVTQVAQRHDVTRQQIYTWQRELKKKGLWSPDDGALFFPVELSSAQCIPEDRPVIHEVPVGSDPVPVELRLSNGRYLRFDRRLDAATLTQLIRSVEAA